MIAFPWVAIVFVIALVVELGIAGVAFYRRRRGFKEAPAGRPEATPSTMPDAWETPPGLVGQLSAVNHKQMGIRYVVTAFFFFVLAGNDSLVLRGLLAVPDSEILGPEKFNQLFTMHGTAMMFLFAVPMLEGIASYLVPLMIGARDMPFPRLNAFGYYTFLFGGLLLYSSTLPDPVNLFSSLLGFGQVLPDVVPHTGWFAYPPLSLKEYSPGLNTDFWLIGVSLLEVAGLVFAAETIVGVFKTRAPGMSANRIPIFVWSVLVMAFAMLFAFPSVLVASLLLELERKFAFPFYNPWLGGDPLLWQHLFWIFGHPEVYIQFIPATGIVSAIVPTVVRRPLAGYTFVVAALMATAFLSFGLWVHHMFAVGLPWLALGFFGASSMMITLPSGVQVFSWIATIWNGARPAMTPPFLFVIGFIITFVLGGITGVMVASVPFDWQVHGTYFVVAHFHYVLVGGVVFPIFAGLHYWWPKVTGRLLDDRLGTWTFWLWFVGFNVTFLPQHNLGFLGMPRRVFTYLPELYALNVVSTIGAFFMAAGSVTFLWNAYRSLRHGERAGDNPWGASTLEWAASSPPPAYNFRSVPQVWGRDPLWEQARLATVIQHGKAVPRHAPHVWRETIGTSVLDAHPEAAVRLPSASYAPLSLALATVFAFVGFLFSLYLLVGLGIVSGIITAIIWLWPSRAERETEGSGPTLRPYSLPAMTSGHRSVGWWGLVLFLTTLAVTFANLLFSYFYLAYGKAAWGPPGSDPWDLVLPLVAGGLLLASVYPVYRAERGVRAGDQGRLRRGLALALVLGTAFLGVQGYDYLAKDFTPQASAYGAIFFTIAGFHVLVTLVGLGMGAVTLAQAWLGYFDRRRFLAVENTALYWYFVAATWAVTFATLYVSPHML